jgi:hypothetical protein
MPFPLSGGGSLQVLGILSQGFGRVVLVYHKSEYNRLTMRRVGSIDLITYGLQMSLIL